MRVITVQVSLSEEDLEPFVAASTVNGRQSVETEPGCRRFDIFRDGNDPARIGFNEVYDNDAAVGAHGDSEHFAAWLAATDGMGDDLVWATCRNLFRGGATRPDASRQAADRPAPGGGIRAYQARISVPADDVDGFVSSLKDQAQTALRHEPKLLRFEINQDLEVPTEIWLFKVHADPAAARDHAVAPYTRAHLDRFGDLYSAGPPPIRGPGIWPPDSEW